MLVAIELCSRFAIEGRDFVSMQISRSPLPVSANLGNFRFVFQTLVNAGIPVVMVLSGGYIPESYQLVARSVREVWETWG